MVKCFFSCHVFRFRIWLAPSYRLCSIYTLPERIHSLREVESVLGLSSYFCSSGLWWLCSQYSRPRHGWPDRWKSSTIASLKWFGMLIVSAIVKKVNHHLVCLQWRLILLRAHLSPRYCLKIHLQIQVQDPSLSASALPLSKSHPF